MDPVVTDDPYTNEVKEMLLPVLTSCEDIINIHDFRIVKGPTHVNIVFDAVINPNTSKSEQEIKNNLEEIVTSVDSKFVPVLTLDRDFSTLE